MKPIIFSVVAFAFLLFHATAQQADNAQLRATAEAEYSQKSYARAHEIYARIDKSKLSPVEVRWVEFRLADTSWRAQAGTQTSDRTKYEEAQKQLEELIRVADKDVDRDLVWAEAHESLGDMFWNRSYQMNWAVAWPHFQQALDWWAGQRDLERARNRYITIVLKVTAPALTDDAYLYGYYGNHLPVAVLENALKISTSVNEHSLFNYLLATNVSYTGGPRSPETSARIADYFEEALKAGKQSQWYDDALFRYAEFMNNYGGLVEVSEGQWQQQPDYVKALELYRRLTTEFGGGESRYVEQATRQIINITSPNIGVAVSNIFLPDSEIQFNLTARNVKRADFVLYKLDLTRDIAYAGLNAEADEGEGTPRNWITEMRTTGKAPFKQWTRDVKDEAYKPVNEQVRIDGKLPVGAYLLEARITGGSARELILVSDATLVLKASGSQALAFFSNALSGAPIGNANVVLWESFTDRNGISRWRRYRQTTNSDGLALISLRDGFRSRELFATVGSGDRQAFVNGAAYGQYDSQQWRIYAFTDRPAYRPKETMQWKFIARYYRSGEYSTPANQVINYEINDPRGAKISEGKVTLNAFGSAWGSLELGEQLPLGQYQITFMDQGRAHLGNAALFRLEEYKLPEFKVAVKTPEQNGKKKAFRVGESVEVDIQAEYYFGGPVSNASVEVVVYQNPFYHFWFPRRDYPWYYDDFTRQRSYYYGNNGQVIKRETLKTDSTGKARLTFDTPNENYNQDFEYRVEARVVDASRREIVSTDTVRVTRQRYYVYPRPERNIYRPQDKVTVDIKAIDANDQAVQTQGTVKVTRDYWWEVWIDPQGREVQGEELRRLQRSGVFPPRLTPGQREWQLKFRGYQHEDILTTTVKTDGEGDGQLSFTPPREGYYRVTWQSSQGADTRRDRFLPPIKAETYVFVATNATTELGYRRSGIEIVVDKDTFRAGQTAPVMISVPVGDRYVLFSVEGDDLFSYKLIHVEGTAKLIELPIEQKYVPNIYLSALTVANATWSLDTKQVVVPPVDQFLAINVKADREQYQPREEGTLFINAKDANGRPVAAEIALGLVDESVKYIQEDYAGDPRQFYYGRKRANQVNTTSTLNAKAYVRLADTDGKLIDVKEVGANQSGGGRAPKDDVLRSVQYLGGRPMAGAVSGYRIDEAERAAYAYRDGIADFGIAGVAKSMEMRPSGTLQSPPESPVVQVRNDFRSTILWLPAVKTDADGTATVKVKYPDSLTTWTATARAATTASQFGIGNSSTRTKQPLIVRLQAPRFFVVGDQVTVSAVINNNTDEPMRVSPALSAEGLTLQNAQAQAPVEVKANSETRVDWTVGVTHASEAKLKVEARGARYADAMEKTFTIFEHGIEKFISRSGKMRGNSVAVKLDLPKERRDGSTSFTVQVAPSMATTMLDALPYLIHYPYGCTEQTMSRFLPAAITAKTLRDLGLKPESAMYKVFGGIEPSSAAATHPDGSRDLKELEAVTKQSLQRLYDFQHQDGGWGWWKDGNSDHFMTAYVIWGMTLARQAGIDVKSDVLERAVAYLDKELVEEETNYDRQAWMLHALAVYHNARNESEVGKFQATAFTNLWNNREKLNAYTRALLALAAHAYHYDAQAKTLVENLQNGVKIDERPDTSIVQRGAQSTDPSVIGTAHWGEDGIYWRWSDGGVEATSFALRALLAIDPQNKLIEPVTNWLIKNRRGAQWSNTRDTAIAVLTLNDYLRTSGELQPVIGYQVLVNGSSIATKQITAAEALSAPTRFTVPRELIRDGVNEVTIVRKNGSGPLYFSAEAEFFSLEEPLKPVGNEIFVRRQYFKLVNHPTLLKGVVSERVPLNDGETVKSGERVEVVLTVEAKNNYEYLLFEDLKPAGLEAVQLRSGENLYIRELKSGALTDKNTSLMNFGSATDFTGRSVWVYQELRDRKVAMFIDRLPEGVWQLSYELRAEAPGAFHALPVLGHAMYVPEIRTNGAETRVRVVD